MAKSKATYVDGFVITMPKAKLGLYKKMATEGAMLWKKYGALDYKECVGDDLKAEWSLPFPKMTKAKEDEIIVFSYITFKDKKHRNEVNKKVMADPAMDPEKWKGKTMPFDMKKMAYGGFKVIVDGN